MDERFVRVPIGRNRILMTSESQKKWDGFDPHVKSFLMKQLSETSKKIEAEIAIEMLCHVVNDLIKRIEILEEEIKK